MNEQLHYGVSIVSLLEDGTHQQQQHSLIKKLGTALEAGAAIISMRVAQWHKKPRWPDFLEQKKYGSCRDLSTIGPVEHVHLRFP